MPRQARCHYEGAVYHVMLRGNAQGDVFFDDGDRARFSWLLEECCKRYQCKVYAFCYMSNHVHLIIKVIDIPLSKLMHNVTFRYTNWINKKLKRVGHLFQGRYKAKLILDDPYLLTVVRYIHLNPVAANIIKDPSHTYWSSHCDYLGAEIHPWVETEFVLEIFSDNKAKAIEAYKKFIFETTWELVPDPKKQ